MSKISLEKTIKIKEEIIRVLFENSPKALFTVEIAKEMARDEEFISRLLKELNTQKITQEVNKNSKGFDYIARKRWQLTNEAYDAYKKLNS